MTLINVHIISYGAFILLYFTKNSIIKKLNLKLKLQLSKLTAISLEARTICKTF